jgi:hypothetical protein
MIGRSVSWLIGCSVGQPQPNVVITLVCVVAVCMCQVLVALFLLFSWVGFMGQVGKEWAGLVAGWVGVLVCPSGLTPTRAGL